MNSDSKALKYTSRKKRWRSGKESTWLAVQGMQERQGQSLSWKDPLERKWQVTPVFLPGKFHGQRSLAGYSPWSLKESDTTEWLSTAQHRGYHIKFLLQFTVNRKHTLNHVNLLKFVRFLFSLAGWNVFILSSFLSNVFADCRILGCFLFDLFAHSK